MSSLSTTRLSSKGQIVIPEAIREAIGLHAGDQFVVVAEKGIVILRLITPPSMIEFDHLIVQARKKAKAIKLQKKSIQDAVEESRKNCYNCGFSDAVCKRSCYGA